MGGFPLAIGSGKFVHTEMENIISLFIINPRSLVIEIMLICHAVGIVTHGPVSHFRASEMIKERLMYPVYKIIPPEKS